MELRSPRPWQPLPGVESQLKDTEVLFVRHNRLQRAAAVTSAKRWGDDRKGELPLWRLTTQVGLSG